MGKLTPFGVELRKLRVEKDLRLFDLANHLGVSTAMVSAIETGRKPIPDGFVTRVAQSLQLEIPEIRSLRSAAEQTRKEVRVEHLRPQEREMVAAFARNLSDLPPDMLAKIRKALQKASDEEVLKSSEEEIPFRRKRLGMMVPPTSAAKIEQASALVRQFFCPDGMEYVDIIRILERLHLFNDRYSFEVLDRTEMFTDEGRVVPSSLTLYLRADVYEKACQGDARSRFTACHELGHLWLHHEVTFARARLDSDPIYCDAEWQADVFAGSFMMPRELVAGRTDVAELAKRFGMSNQAVTVLLSKYRKG